jgi:hypothetical protein
VVAGSGEETLVWRYTETVDLRVWMLNGARANSRQCFPETRGKATLARLGIFDRAHAASELELTELCDRIQLSQGRTSHQ